jgi:hypothetical protein
MAAEPATYDELPCGVLPHVTYRSHINWDLYSKEQHEQLLRFIATHPKVHRHLVKKLICKCQTPFCKKIQHCVAAFSRYDGLGKLLKDTMEQNEVLEAEVNRLLAIIEGPPAFSTNGLPMPHTRLHEPMN